MAVLRPVVRHDIRLFRLAGLSREQGSRKIISLDVNCDGSGMTRCMIPMKL